MWTVSLLVFAVASAFAATHLSSKELCAQRGSYVWLHLPNDLMDRAPAYVNNRIGSDEKCDIEAWYEVADLDGLMHTRVVQNQQSTWYAMSPEDVTNTKAWLFNYVLVGFCDLDTSDDWSKGSNVHDFLNDMVAVRCDDPDATMPYERGHTIYGRMDGQGLIRVVNARGVDRKVGHDRLGQCDLRKLTDRERSVIGV